MPPFSVVVAVAFFVAAALVVVVLGLGVVDAFFGFGGGEEDFFFPNATAGATGVVAGVGGVGTADVQDITGTTAWGAEVGGPVAYIAAKCCFCCSTIFGGCGSGWGSFIIKCTISPSFISHSDIVISSALFLPPKMSIWWAANTPSVFSIWAFKSPMVKVGSTSTGMKKVSRNLIVIRIFKIYLYITKRLCPRGNDKIRKTFCFLRSSTERFQFLVVNNI